jgi:hypothetical protein
VKAKTRGDATFEWRGHPVPPAFVKFCRLFHQDTTVIYGSIDRAIADYVQNFLSAPERDEVQKYLEKLLSGKYDDSDLKGLMNRMPTAFFFNSRRAKALLQTTFNELKAL